MTMIEVEDIAALRKAAAFVEKLRAVEEEFGVRMLGGPLILTGIKGNFGVAQRSTREAPRLIIGPMPKRADS